MTTPISRGPVDVTVGRLRLLLHRGLRQIEAWQEFYGRHCNGPTMGNVLPPSGDVQWAEAVSEVLDTPTDVMDRAALLRKMNEAMDDVLIEAAASMMRHKLAKARNKGRGGWWNPKECTAKGLREAMERHTEKGDPVDVMNLAAMVAVREMLEPPNA